VINERVDPVLSWSSVPGARTYDVLVSTSQVFAPGTIIFQSSRTDTSVVAHDLPPGRVLFWHARAGNELGVGPFSEARLFQTTFAPVVLSPIDDILLAEGSTTVDLRPVFSDPEGGVLTYRVVSLSDSTVVSTGVALGILTVQQTGDGSTTVTVGARDPQGAETTTSFGVIAGTATANEGESLPGEEFGIGNNYPNPFAASSVVPITLSESANVKLTLFDLLGSEVATLVDERLSSGHHDVVVRSDGLAPGVYLLKLEAGAKVAMSSVIVTH
jgi:hypothetical protein